MVTAYMIHSSEGIPVRRLIETTIEFNKTLFDEESNEPYRIKVAISTADHDWDSKSFAKEYVLSQFLTLELAKTVEADHHKKLRREMSRIYGVRFEIY